MKVTWTVLAICLFTSRRAASVPRLFPTEPQILKGTQSVTPTVDASARLVDWLTKYGYLPHPDPSTGQLQVWTAVTQALKAMQRFAGLADTGALDVETLRLMQTPRCSLPDDDSSRVSPTSASDTGVHRTGKKIKRALSTWSQRNINWRLRTYPVSSALSREMIRSLVFYALKVWAEPTLLEFHEVAGPEGADFYIDFLYGPHGDGYPFDGVGGAVGHAFFPADPERAGEVHLDAQEEWAFRQPDSEGTDAFTVLVHEIGHALGLSHSSARGSVMRPYYQGPLGDPLNFSLGAQDTELITVLYGKRGDPLQTNAPSMTPEIQLKQSSDTHRLTHMHKQPSRLDSPSIDRCNTSFDAVAKIRGETFFFKGMSMWRVNRGGLVSRRGVSVRRLWGALPNSLPSPLRAVLERNEDHAIIFISGSQYWVFRDLTLQEGFPQPLSSLDHAAPEGGWTGLCWDRDKGAVWRSGREEEEREEEEGHVWRELIKGGVNGIITESDGSLYLFKGDSYWKFAHPGSAPDKGFPRPVANDWLDCPDPASHHTADISLYSVVGQQEWQEGKRQEAVDQIKHVDKSTERHNEHHGNCPCFNGATQTNQALKLLMFSLVVHTLNYIPTMDHTYYQTYSTILYI